MVNKMKGEYRIPSGDMEGMREIVIFGLCQLSEKDHDVLDIPLSKALADNLRGIPGLHSFLMQTAPEKGIDRKALDNALSFYMLQELHKSGLPLQDMKKTVSGWISE